MKIVEALAGSDRSNAGLQRDLSVSHDKLGRLFEKLGRMDDAIPHYRADLEIAERLAAIDPSNVQWQQDAEISRERMRRLGVLAV